MTAPDPDTPAAGDPAVWLAEGFARHLQRWALGRGARAADAAAVMAAGRALSLATGNGHACLVLDDLPPRPPSTAADGAVPDHCAAWRTALLASGVVGTADDPAGQALVLDDGDRLYLHRYFDFERRLARRLARCMANPAPPDAVADAATATLLAGLFAAAPPLAGEPAPVDWQQIAAAMALRGRLTVISGGPGTGKTTTVARLLAGLLARRPEARIVLAAPTGKAAARLAQALSSRAGELSQAIRARLPTESFTLHRLLGVRPAGARDGTTEGDGGFIHHAGHPLALDVLVVDEASMLDLALATRLLEAVPEHARIILLGDKDQLEAVESGAVFAELSADPSLSAEGRRHLGALCGLAAERIRPAAGAAQPGALRDAVVWFDRNHRFAADSGIGRLAADTVAGRTEAALAWLRSGADSSVRWLDDSGTAPSPATLAQIVDGYAPYQAALREAALDGDAAGRAGRLFEAFGMFRVLCALRDGPRGVDAINQAVGAQLQTALGQRESRSPWFAGRPVMVLRNDPALKLFNGDIGLTLPDAGGTLMVYFTTAEGGLRAVAPLRLPMHQTAFAMTVHKSQGSEFNAVLVLLPAQRSRVLTRELLYTAITRARDRVLLAAGAPVLAAAIDSVTRRHSGLQARLHEALAAPA